MFFIPTFLSEHLFAYFFVTMSAILIVGQFGKKYDTATKRLCCVLIYYQVRK